MKKTGLELWEIMDKIYSDLIVNEKDSEDEKIFKIVIIGTQTNSGLEDFEMVDFEFEFPKPSISQIKKHDAFEIEYQEFNCDNILIGEMTKRLSQEEFIKYIENPYSFF